MLIKDFNMEILEESELEEVFAGFSLGGLSGIRVGGISISGIGSGIIDISPCFLGGGPTLSSDC